ncbi:uncharacterized protein LOC122061736 [Macadamia integrifolia]|uniref:uncharacterized protein LOC122061736 n=1 Tax=Macadamia integrifolia TaxID=60698 RepID=UPI001C533FAE|nr:uncharacterized protein LOC122061736 [Macadamia integrifolia]
MRSSKDGSGTIPGIISSHSEKGKSIVDVVEVINEANDVTNTYSGGCEYVMSDSEDEDWKMQSDDGFKDISKSGSEEEVHFEDGDGSEGDEASIGTDDLSDYDSDEFHAPQVRRARSVFDVEGKVQLEDGMIFDDVDHFRRELKDYAIQEGFHLQRIKNERTRVTVICADDGCQWRIHASPTEDKITFMIKSFNPQHTCSQRKDKNPDATSRWIANKLGPQLKADPELSTNSIRAMLWKDYKIQPSYSQIWRARLLAKEVNEGSHAKSYSKLPRYGEMVRQTNPGSMFNLQFISRTNMADNPVFKRCFVCYEASKRGFLNGCRPFIGLDGCHLKGKFEGTLLAAISVDGNNGLFPLAYAVVESECKDSWLWFLQNLYTALYSTSDDMGYLTFMSDKQKGLTDAIKEVFLESHTRHCSRHLYANFRKDYKGEKLKALFWTASRAYREIEWTKAMAEIKSINQKAYDFLMENQPSSWSRWAFNHQTKSDHITNNMTESFNNLVGPYRDKPILYLIDQVRISLMDKLHKRFEQACSYKGTLTPKIKKRMDVIHQQSRSCVALSAGYNEFEVNDGTSRFVVNLNTRKCGCQGNIYKPMRT